MGCYAANPTQDGVLGGLTAAQSVIPVATFKPLTAAVALEILGRRFRVETIMQYDRKVDEEETLHGNIYIRGRRGPVPGFRNFQNPCHRPHLMATWGQAVQIKSIKKVADAVIGGAQIYADSIMPDTWVVGGLSECYIAFAIAVNHYNCPRSMVKKRCSNFRNSCLVGQNDIPNALKV
jgi:D-alanyl-D-alanine carboxypeptidase